ncbi:MAG: hypothetical protein L0Z62_41140 [Gemmataceae bacterium]|nr:hypothetical protein [Gemmataceae bacterium]
MKQHHTLYVSWRRVYDFVAACYHAGGNGAAAPCSWQLRCVCPHCKRPVSIAFAPVFNGRGQVLGHSLDPVKADCDCGARLTERELFLSGLTVQWADVPAAVSPSNGAPV